MADNINDELKEAVSKNDLEKVKLLLSKGADANLKLQDHIGTLLHVTCNVEIARLLLQHGARVNESNMYRRTPLHLAVTEFKGLEFIKLLLKHRAHVNARDSNGNTSLNSAVIRTYDDFDTIKELLEHGANINMRNRQRCSGPYYGQVRATPLDNATHKNLEYTKLLIKMTLINDFDDYQNSIDLDPYKTDRDYTEYTRYLDNCVSEVLKMKRYKVTENLSLFEFVTKKRTSVKKIHDVYKIQELLSNFPIYHDVISSRVNLQRVYLLKKLNECQISMRMEKKEVILNSDCAIIIAKYLSNEEDLLSLVKAFYKKNSVELDQTQNVELEESDSSAAKRAKLE